MASLGTSSAAQHPITAIDILLEPDATMIQHAEAVNARLLKHFPKGFSLDATHRPHITIAQRFVRTADLDKVYEATEEVLANAKPARWILKAFKQYFMAAGLIGGAGIVVEPTAELLRLQQNLLDAVAPFVVESATAKAFFTTPEDLEINPAGIDYIVTFIPKASGKNFNPHVTTGVGTVEYLNAMVAEPFEPFTFSPVAASVYQLGNLGTARKKLKTWDFNPQKAAYHW
jgi:2'-5' RNA ligase superfamily